jgi:hypothetical protein
MSLLYKLYYTKYCLYIEDYINSLVEQQRNKPTPQAIDPGATQASKRILQCSSPSHLRLLSRVTARVSRLMVATQQVKGENIIIYAGSKQN